MRTGRYSLSADLFCSFDLKYVQHTLACALLCAHLPNVKAHFGTTYQDIIKDDKTGAGTQLKQLYANFVNDSELAYGLGQELDQIAQNNSAHIDSHIKQILSAISTDLKDIALRSNSTRANNSTNSK
jgi:hypothetical protein